MPRGSSHPMTTENIRTRNGRWTCEEQTMNANNTYDEHTKWELNKWHTFPFPFCCKWKEEPKESCVWIFTASQSWTKVWLNANTTESYTTECKCTYSEPLEPFNFKQPQWPTGWSMQRRQFEPYKVFSGWVWEEEVWRVSMHPFCAAQVTMLETCFHQPKIGCKRTESTRTCSTIHDNQVGKRIRTLMQRRFQMSVI